MRSAKTGNGRAEVDVERDAKKAPAVDECVVLRLWVPHEGLLGQSMTPAQARRVAGLLLKAANEAEGRP